jgi:hypothetical protein
MNQHITLAIVDQRGMASTHFVKKYIAIIINVCPTEKGGEIFLIISKPQTKKG